MRKKLKRKILTNAGRKFILFIVTLVTIGVLVYFDKVYGDSIVWLYGILKPVVW